MSEYDEFVAKLVELGEEQARANLAQGIWSGKRKPWAEQWLQGKQLRRDADIQTVGVNTAKEANLIAKSASKQPGAQKMQLGWPHWQRSLPPPSLCSFTLA